MALITGVMTAENSALSRISNILKSIKILNIYISNYKPLQTWTVLKNFLFHCKTGVFCEYLWLEIYYEIYDLKNYSKSWST